MTPETIRVLSIARNAFAEYEEHHLARAEEYAPGYKVRTDSLMKAARNADLAAMCDREIKRLIDRKDPVCLPEKRAEGADS